MSKGQSMFIAAFVMLASGLIMSANSLEFVASIIIFNIWLVGALVSIKD